MKQSYLTPFIKAHDFSKFQFAQNQATCAPGIFTLAQDNSPHECGFGFINDDRVAICLTTGGIDPNLLEGLFVNTLDGNSFVTSNCFQDNATAGCPSGGYICTTSGFYGSGGNRCLFSLECPDGIVITTCGDSSDCTGLVVIDE